MLHNVGEIEKVEYETNNKVNTEITTKNGEFPRHDDALMFVQPDVSSLMDRSDTSSKTIRIPNTWILPESQSTIYVLYNGELLAQIHKTNITLRIRCNAGMKTTNMSGHLSEYGWVWFYP